MKTPHDAPPQFPRKIATAADRDSPAADRRRSPRPLRTWPRRVLLWSVLVVAVAALFAGNDRAHDQLALETGAAMLAAGDGAAAADVFSRHLDSIWVGAEAQIGHVIAATMIGDDSGLAGDGLPGDDDPPSLRQDARFPLRTYARTAFDRGEFAQALRLDALAEDRGLGADPVLRSAALIELGESDRARALWQRDAGRIESRALGHRVASYLSQPDSFDRTVLLDRHGVLLGVLTHGGQLELAEGVSPQLVPPMVAELVGGQEPRPGVLRLTLDLALSEMAASALGAYQGSIVLLDPRDGQILAAVSDETSMQDGSSPAFEQMREPASILKLVTTSATQRAGVDPDAEISQWRCPGHVRLDGEMLYCSSPRGDMEGLDHVMAISCNVAFAKLAVDIGRDRVLEELRRFGFDSELGPFPGGNVVVAEGDDRQLGDLAIGLEATETTPLHAALLAATMHDGVMPTPTLLAATDGRLGLHPAALPVVEGRRIIADREHLHQLQRSMLAVAAEGGTAKNVEPPGMEVAMKTGTASDDRHGYHINYIGIAPMPDPEVAFAIRITGYWSSRRVRGAGSIVTRRLLHGLDDILRQRGTLDDPPRSQAPGRVAEIEPASSLAAEATIARTRGGSAPAR